MKLKLKQSNSDSKHFVLPYIKNPQHHRYTPRSSNHRRSNPKIPELNPSPQQIKQLYSKIKSLDKPPLKDKIKSIQQRNKHQTPLHHRNQTSVSKDLDDAYISDNLKRQIEKNLAFIKREKENKKKSLVQQRIRYRTPRSLTIENDPYLMIKKTEKCITEQDDVFSKISQIINKSQPKKSMTEVEQSRNISFSSFLSKQNNYSLLNRKPSKRKFSREKLKTEDTPQGIHQRPKQHSSKQLKTQQNYHQWRKVSIDETQQSKVSYHLSSFDHQTDRIQKIRCRNQISLKKYIQGKSYLTKLIKYKNSRL